MSEQTNYSPLRAVVGASDLPQRVHSLISHKPGCKLGMTVNQTILQGSPSWWGAVLRLGYIAWRFRQLSEEEYSQIADDIWLIDFDQTVIRYSREELYDMAGIKQPVRSGLKLRKDNSSG
jgi:hypothetical protein